MRKISFVQRIYRQEAIGGFVRMSVRQPFAFFAALREYNLRVILELTLRYVE